MRKTGSERVWNTLLPMALLFSLTKCVYWWWKGEQEQVVTIFRWWWWWLSELVIIYHIRQLWHSSRFDIRFHLVVSTYHWNHAIHAYNLRLLYRLQHTLIIVMKIQKINSINVYTGISKLFISLRFLFGFLDIVSRVDHLFSLMRQI